MALAEALIACAIIAAMLGVTYEAVETTARASYRLRGEQQAVEVAQSVMARVGADIALAPGTVGGSENGLDWRIDMERYHGDGAQPNDDPALMEVVVSVRRSGEARPLFDLRTLRLTS